MISVTGVFRDGVAQPDQSVNQDREGQAVIITFLEDNAHRHTSGDDSADWDAMIELIDACTVRTGIQDLAHQHDHYLHGKAKRE